MTPTRRQPVDQADRVRRAARARERTNTDPAKCPHTTCGGCPTARTCMCPPCACPDCQRRTLAAKVTVVTSGLRKRADVPPQERLFDPEPNPVRDAARRRAA